MCKTKSETNWQRVLAVKEGDKIPYAPEDGPYDPNDADAARAWLAQAVMTKQNAQLESVLKAALESKEITIDTDELKNRSLISILRSKLS